MTMRFHVVACSLLFTFGLVFAVSAGEPVCPDSAVVFEEGGDISAPKAITKVNPKYPEEARKEGVMGSVVLDAVIDTSGDVIGLNVAEDPDPRLSAAAVEAVQQWTFDPARDANDKPVAVCYSLTIKFHLN